MEARVDDHVSGTNESARIGPRKYMSKGRRACDLCRSRKSACQIEVAPPCRMCRGLGKECEFTNRVVRKKRPTLQQAQSENAPALWHQEATRRPATEFSWPQSLQFLSMPDANLESASSDMQTRIFGLADVRHTPTDQLPSGLLSGPENADQFTIDDLMLSMYGDKDLSEVFPGSRIGSNSLDHASLTPQICGLTGDMDPYVLRHYQFDGNWEFVFSKLAIRKVEDGQIPVQFLLSKPELSAESRCQTTLRPGLQSNDHPSLSEIVPVEVAERLIELFYRFINSQFPILSRANKPCPRTSPTHLLAAVYSITQPFTVFDDYLSIELAYSPPSPQILSNIAWRSLNEDLSEPTICSLQTALILLLQPPSNPLLLESALKWVLLGMTVSMAQTLGLYLDPTAWNLPLAEIESRKRLAWLVWAVDKWSAYYLGRPSHISRNDWMIIEFDGNTEQNPAPEASDQSNRSYTEEFSKLTLILDTVLTDLYSIRSVSVLSQDYQLAITTAQPIIQRLDEWHENLPSALGIRKDTDESSAGLPNGSASLHIAYYAVKILVFRALLRPFNRLNNEMNLIPAMGNSGDEWNSTRTRIRNAALSEVTSVLGLISSFRQEHCQAFWAPWSKTSFALITNLLFLLSVTSDRDTRVAIASSPVQLPVPDRLNPNYSQQQQQEMASDDRHLDGYAECRQTLERARSIFRLHAKTLEMIRFALLRIDAIFWIGWEKVLGFK